MSLRIRSTAPMVTRSIVSSIDNDESGNVFATNSVSLVLHPQVVLTPQEKKIAAFFFRFSNMACNVVGPVARKEGVL